VVFLACMRLPTFWRRGQRGFEDLTSVDFSAVRIEIGAWTLLFNGLIVGTNRRLSQFYRGNCRRPFTQFIQLGLLIITMRS